MTTKITLQDAITTYFLGFDDTAARSKPGFFAFKHAGCGFLTWASGMLPDTLDQVFGVVDDDTPIVSEIVRNLQDDLRVAKHLHTFNFDFEDSDAMAAGVREWLADTRGQISGALTSDHTWLEKAVPGASQELEIEEYGTIGFDFARAYYSGMHSVLYRVQCGTMYIYDIPHVEREIARALDSYEESDEECFDSDDDDTTWYDVLLSSEEEIGHLKSEYRDVLKKLAQYTIEP